MEREKVKEILLFCRDIDGEIKLMGRIMKRYEDKFYSTSSTLEGLPHGKYRTGNPTATAALNIPGNVAAEMRKLEDNIEQVTKLKVAILQELNKLPLLQKSIIYDFYITGLQWVQISSKVHYGTTQCKKIRNRGLDNLAQYFNKNDLIKKFNYPF